MHFNLYYHFLQYDCSGWVLLAATSLLTAGPLWISFTIREVIHLELDTCLWFLLPPRLLLLLLLPKKTVNFFRNSQKGGWGVRHLGKIPKKYRFFAFTPKMLKHVFHTGGSNIWSILSIKVHLIWDSLRRYGKKRSILVILPLKSREQQFLQSPIQEWSIRSFCHPDGYPVAVLYRVSFLEGSLEHLFASFYQLTLYSS